MNQKRLALSSPRLFDVMESIIHTKRATAAAVERKTEMLASRDNGRAEKGEAGKKFLKWLKQSFLYQQMARLEVRLVDYLASRIFYCFQCFTARSNQHRFSHEHHIQ
jgi:hypothetical protein